MLHVVIDPNDTVAWYPNYLSGLKKGLEEAGASFQYTTKLPDNPSEPVLLTRFTLFEQIRSSSRPPEHLFIQEHDVWNPFTNVVDPRDLWIFKHPSLKGVLYTNTSMVPWGERCLAPDSQAVVVAAGFPYDHDYVKQAMGGVEAAPEREKLVVFPGRMNEFYQPYLAVRMAKEFVDRGYRVFIASPTQPLPHYPIELWKEMGIEIGRLPHQDYYRLLSKAQAAVSVTIGGSLTLALYEAHLLGATPIAPMGRNGLPPFTEMYEPRYDLLSPIDAVDMVESGAQVHIEKKWFSHRFYVETLLNTIELQAGTL